MVCTILPDYSHIYNILEFYATRTFGRESYQGPMTVEDG